MNHVKTNQMKEQKKYHQRKLAIIEMIDSCETQIKLESKAIERYKVLHPDIIPAMSKNIERYERIKHRLSLWLGE